MSLRDLCWIESRETSVPTIWSCWRKTTRGMPTS
jgi:hypothetical protein